jgi:hypothetical protein
MTIIYSQGFNTIAPPRQTITAGPTGAFTAVQHERSRDRR